MKFNAMSYQWELEESDLVDMGVQLRERLASRRAANPDAIIQNLLTRTSEMIYAYIHQYSVYNAKQDAVLCRYDSAKHILYRALRSQVMHILNVGDLSFSIKEDERRNAINDVAKSILGEVIPEIGISILNGRIS